MTAPRPVTRPSAAHVVIEEVEEVVDRALDTLEGILAIPEPLESRSRWHRAGLRPRGERIFDVASGLFVFLLVCGWSWSIAMAARDRAEEGDDAGPDAVGITSSMTNPDASNAAYLTSATLEALTPLRGASGKLRVAMRQPGAPIGGDTAAGAHVAIASGEVGGGATDAAPTKPGVWRAALALGAAIKPVTDFSIISLVPFSAKRGGRVGLYYVGSWPGEKAKRAKAGYEPPSGFIEVTPQNADTYVSEHFRLRDFLTHDQPNVWPKYLVLQPKLVDKLELVLADLQAHGVDPKGVRVMSGFRTPRYNVRGGDPSGRAALSRHMYGDASDIFIDNDGNGQMDDLNHDRRINTRDAEVIQAAVDRVERAHPELLGGCGTYPGNSAHGPFTHIDTRGFRARWVGTGDG